MKLQKIKDYIPIEETLPEPFDVDKLRLFGFKQFQTLYDPSKPNDPENLKFKGKLYPLYIKGQNNVNELDGIELHKWYRCGQGELLGCFDDNGNPILDENGEIKIGGVKSVLGKLSFRPGWHLGSAPVTRHIGVGASKELMFDKEGKPIMTKGKNPHQKQDYGAMYSQNVWATVGYAGYGDVTEKQLVTGKNGKIKCLGIRDFRENEYYRNKFYHFKTNTNADNNEDWIIADTIYVINVLTDEEVKRIAKAYGLKAQYRWEADGTENNMFMADFSQFK